MGQSEHNLKGIDATVGGLVWVRRRNGSWWPGRIMGLDELSETSLVSPRSGTPVKLLGREDASVDWYNIEKSKRVKAFRCGEYDECIEKAKAYAAHPAKKAVKYARREDAILHALELESARNSKASENIYSRTDHSLGSKNGILVKQSQNTLAPGKDERGYKFGQLNILESNLTQEASESVISFEQTDHYMQRSKRKTPNDSEDDGGAKRMRGLQDLGLKVTSKQKPFSSLTEGTHELGFLADSGSPSESNFGYSLSNGSPVQSSKGSSSTLKRRRSQAGQVYENLGRKNRRRPLTKVLESTTKLAIPGSDDPIVSQDFQDGLESTESKGASPVNTNSDCTGTSSEKEISLNGSQHVYETGNDHPMMIGSAFSDMLELPDDCYDTRFLNALSVKDAKQTRDFPHTFISSTSRRHRSGMVGRHVLGKDHHETGYIFPNQSGHKERNAENGASKWQSKRKRNKRHSGKKAKKGKKAKGGSFCKAPNSFFEDFHTSDNSWRRANDRSTLEEGSLHYRHSLRTKEAAEKRSPFFIRGTPITQTVNKKLFLASKAEPNYEIDAMPLFDVDLNVRTSYQGQHVPLVSLMSRLNGKAIIGHPITVEVLEDGSSDALLARVGHLLPSRGAHLSTDGGIWSPDSGAAAVETNAWGYGSGDVLQNKGGYSGHLYKKNQLEKPSLLGKKSPKMKKCGSSMKKTRKLSLISLDKGIKDEQRKSWVGKLGGPVTACIPVNLVFSRIKEAVG